MRKTLCVSALLCACASLGLKIKAIITTQQGIALITQNLDGAENVEDITFGMNDVLKDAATIILVDQLSYLLMIIAVICLAVSILVNRIYPSYSN